MMKKLSNLLLSVIMVLLFISCEKASKKEDSNELNGDQSPMGKVGAIVSTSSAPIGGISNFSAKVTDLKDGVSIYNGSVTVTNVFLKDLIANFPGVTIDGNKVILTDLQLQNTTEGIKCITGPGAGILVKYDSEVGDTYSIGSTGKVRTVVKKTGLDDYSYSSLLIKVIQVEETPSYYKHTSGITKITYIANHKFGLVGVKVSYDDGTSTTFPVYNSNKN